MSSKANVRKLTNLPACNGHVPPSHQRYQNRAAAVYDMTIDCHDIKTICHVHRLSEATILQDWKGDLEYLQNKMDLSDIKEIKRRFVSIIKEIEEDDLQPTLAAVAHHIPFVYIEQVMIEKNIDNVLNRFLDDFDPQKMPMTKPMKTNIIVQRLHRGEPVLTQFEKHLLVEHLRISLSSNKTPSLVDIKTCLLERIQLIMKTNYSPTNNIAHLDQTWLQEFLAWARPQLRISGISWCDHDQPE